MKHDTLCDDTCPCSSSNPSSGLQREIGGRLWLLLLSFYGVYYGAYLYLVYKILQSLPGGYYTATLQLPDQTMLPLYLWDTQEQYVAQYAEGSIDQTSSVSW